MSSSSSSTRHMWSSSRSASFDSSNRARNCCHCRCEESVERGRTERHRSRRRRGCARHRSWDGLYLLECGTEEVLAELFEAGAGDGGVEIDTVEEGVDFDGGLGGGRESALGALASRAEASESAGVDAEV